MNKRPKWEILIGDNRKLDFLATRFQKVDQPHSLQLAVEEAIEKMLTDDEKEIFYMRFGERIPHREIAERLGYTSHQIIQSKLERIQNKIKEALQDG